MRKTLSSAPPSSPPASLPVPRSPRPPGRRRPARRPRRRATTPLLADTRELCDTIGGRPVGSPANARAVAWAAAKFKAAGADAVATEPFPVPFLWLPGTAELSIVAPESVPLRVVACPAAPSTNGALTAKAVDAGEGTDEDFARLGAKAKGAIAVVRSKEMKTADGPLRRVHAQRRDLRGREEGGRRGGPPAVHAPARPPLPPPGRPRPRARAAAGGDGLARARRAPPAPRGDGRRHRPALDREHGRARPTTPRTSSPRSGAARSRTRSSFSARTSTRGTSARARTTTA